MTSSKDKPSRVPWIALAVALLIVVIAATVFSYLKHDKEPPWDQKFNTEVSDIDINLGKATEPAVFEFHLSDNPPHFSVILCKGEEDDKRLQRDSWYTFFDKVAQQGRFADYKAEFTNEGVIDDRPQMRVMLFIDVYRDTDSKAATDVARNIANVMRESSPCK